MLAQHGAPALHRLLDAPTAARLQPNDSQRIARAYEVLLGTGRGLAFWQARPRAGLSGWRVRMILLDPPRERLAEAIAVRFAAMLDAGALDEVRDLLALNLPPGTPLLRAHGVPELTAYLRGESSLAEAKAGAVLATQQYTKRQRTWFRHQRLVHTPDMQIIQSGIGSDMELSERFIDSLTNFMTGAG